MKQILARFLALLAGPRLQLFALILAGPAVSGLVVWLVKLVSRGWPVDRAEQQIAILGWALFGALAILGLIIVALAAGLIRGVKLSAGAASLEVDLDDNA